MSSSSNHLLENFIKPDSIKIAIIGLGYVGLPLAIEFAAHYDVIGFDINIDRINKLKRGDDDTREADMAKLQGVVK